MSSRTEVVNFEGIGTESIDLLKEINSVIFPIKYQARCMRHMHIYAGWIWYSM